MCYKLYNWCAMELNFWYHELMQKGKESKRQDTTVNNTGGNPTTPPRWKGQERVPSP